MSSIPVGSAPDSWGVWVSRRPESDAAAVPLPRRGRRVRYQWIELGPHGYLPTDLKQLSDELVARNLRLSAGTVFEHLHQDDSLGRGVEADRGRRKADRSRRGQARRRHPRGR